jgi:hypothetical protein
MSIFKKIKGHFTPEAKEARRKKRIEAYGRKAEEMVAKTKYEESKLPIEKIRHERTQRRLGVSERRMAIQSKRMGLMERRQKIMGQKPSIMGGAAPAPGKMPDMQATFQEAFFPSTFKPRPIPSAPKVKRRKRRKKKK